jgi:hypothetical protein
LQQETLGILGVNLIYGAYYKIQWNDYCVIYMII